MLVRRGTRLTKQPTRLPSRSGRPLPELGVPTIRSSLPLKRRSRTLKAASTVAKRLLPLLWATFFNCSTMPTCRATCTDLIHSFSRPAKSRLMLLLCTACHSCYKAMSASCMDSPPTQTRHTYTWPSQAQTATVALCSMPQLLQNGGSFLYGQFRSEQGNASS